MVFLSVADGPDVSVAELKTHQMPALLLLLVVLIILEGEGGEGIQTGGPVEGGS